MGFRRNPARSDPRARYNIWVRCDDCGDVRIAGERTTLLRDVRSDEVHLAYRCTVCRLRASTWVPIEQLRRLLARGFHVETWHPPLELTEPHPVGEAFTHDDLLAAHELLETSPYIVELLLQH
jgi:hypothetical protein